MAYDTIREAAEAWVNGFNAIPISVVEKLWEHSGYVDFAEITPMDEDEEFDTPFPMWGTMWAFDDSADQEWANGEYLGPHLKEMADCGFRIYESEDWGLVFGIDGAGYDFYESHWILLYKERGLQWHKEEAT